MRSDRRGNRGAGLTRPPAARSTRRCRRPAACRISGGRLSFRGFLNGRDDSLMRAAAAEISIHLLDDRIARGVRLLLQQRPGVHDHARRAESALESAVLDERLLERMQLAVAFESFDRHDVLSLDVAKTGLT